MKISLIILYVTIPISALVVMMSNKPARSKSRSAKSSLGTRYFFHKTNFVAAGLLRRARETTDFIPINIGTVEAVILLFWLMSISGTAGFLFFLYLFFMIILYV